LNHPIPYNYLIRGKFMQTFLSCIFQFELIEYIKEKLFFWKAQDGKKMKTREKLMQYSRFNNYANE
jgi:hypothetical protein